MPQPYFARLPKGADFDPQNSKFFNVSRAILLSSLPGETSEMRCNKRESRTMRSVFAAALLVTFATLAHAETMEVRPKSPVASFTFPDDWETDRTARGIQANTEDDEVYIWIETYLPNELDTVVAEHNSYWAKQGVKITGRDLKQHVENGVTVQVVSETATWKGKPTVLYYMEYDLSLASKRNILITYWASPEGSQENSEAVKSIIDSMEITEKGWQSSQ